ncbi:hypothetical protein FHS10_004536 [Mucilaginibacter dorajii]|nr:hypothetical protein [Mucilaginibacter dorajii]MCS3736569.1 hypothetical protein [Mucilaginibacter dorajii]
MPWEYISIKRYLVFIAWCWLNDQVSNGLVLANNRHKYLDAPKVRDTSV